MKICVVTGSRSEYGLLRPLLIRLNEDVDVTLQLVVTGSHLSVSNGFTVSEIIKDGFNINLKVEIQLDSDNTKSVIKSMGLAFLGVVEAFSALNPDCVVLLGDRYEIFAVASVAFMLRIPVCHISGGDITEGAYDDVLRHCITKLSHLHFTTTQDARLRVIQLGEDPERVFYLGNIALDAIRSKKKLTKNELYTKLGLNNPGKWAIVTFHSVTMEYQNTAKYIDNLLKAISLCGLNAVFTMANADEGGKYINDRLQEFCANFSQKFIFLNNLGDLYYSLLSHVDVMIGNSSSGIVEAASFNLPVVNIGNRQKGRIKGSNVIDCGYEAFEIIKAIEIATSNEFKKKIMFDKNPYENEEISSVSEAIVNIIKNVKPKKMMTKKFYNLQS